MNVGSLFSGIGGIDLGLERAGMQISWQCERDFWCQRVLAKHWPNVPRYHDIRLMPADDIEPIDVLAGGFPCQPVSLAGERRAQTDERWLWPEFARLIRLLRPRYVLVENVPGLLSAGMGDVLGDLAAGGYDAEWDSIGAVDVGAPHRRKRIWIVAYPSRIAEHEPHDEGQTQRDQGHARMGAPVSSDRRGEREPAPLMADATSGGREGRQDRIQGDGRDGEAAEWSESLDQPTRSRHVLDAHGSTLDAWRERWGASQAGRAGWWAVEPDVGRVAHGVPARLDRLGGLGNAVVPQVVEWIGRRMMAHASTAERPQGRDAHDAVVPEREGHQQ